jgi:hypothetical protein
MGSPFLRRIALMGSATLTKKIYRLTVCPKQSNRLLDHIGMATDRRVLTISSIEQLAAMQAGVGHQDAELIPVRKERDGLLEVQPGNT